MRSSIRGRRPGRSMAAVLSLLAIAAIAVACGAAASAPGGAASAGGPANGGGLPAASSAPRPPANGGSDNTGAGNNGGSSSGQVGGNGDAVALVDETKIVRTGSLQLTVDDVAVALNRARAAIATVGGYIGASQQERTDDHVVASVTYRIPVTRWEDALADLRALGTVIGEKTDSTEVTGQLVDLDARIRNLKASEAALVGYAEKAPKVSDLLEIQSRLTDTRGQIEQLTAQQARIQDQAAMSTLTVTFGTEAVAVVETAQRWDPGAEVDRATATLIGMGQAVVSFAIVLVIVWVPLIIVISIVAAIGLVVWRRLGWSRTDRVPPLAPPPSSAEI